MKIIKLSVENVKRIRAVDITPDQTVQVVTGRNAQGKTSLLDAIWLTLGGGQASRESAMPIRSGETHARAVLDLGELIATRTWTETGSTLTLTNTEGAKFPSPQARLDELVGRLTFDPLAFTRLSAAGQRDALLELVGVGPKLAEIDSLRRGAYDERTETGRSIRALGDCPAPDDSVPTVEVSAAKILAQYQEAEQLVRRCDDEMRTLELAQSEVEYWQDQLAQAQAGLEKARSQYDSQLETVKSLPERPDLQVFTTQLDEVEATNRKVRENAERRKAAARKAELEHQVASLSARIAGLDETKAALLAEASFPVDGLGFDESGVTFGGVPFGQASSAEQIRVSLAMAMALNPTLRVIRIKDGSLLDADSMRLITEAAAAHDFQVWIERVDDDSPGAVVIEDGAVR